MQNLPYDNKFDLHENEPIGGTHFDMNGFAPRLVLIQRQKVTWKWPIPVNSRPWREFRSSRDCEMVHSGFTRLFSYLMIEIRKHTISVQLALIYLHYQAITILDRLGFFSSVSRPIANLQSLFSCLFSERRICDNQVFCSLPDHVLRLEFRRKTLLD